MKTYIYLPYLYSIYYDSPVPAPPQREAWYTLCKIFRYIFRKKLRALPCPYAEDYTSQECRPFFKIHSSDNSTYVQNPAGILFRCASIIFPNIERWQIDLPKRAVSSHMSSHRNTHRSSYAVCSGSALNMIDLHNRNGTRYSLSKQ